MKKINLTAAPVFTRAGHAVKQTFVFASFEGERSCANVTFVDEYDNCLGLLDQVGINTGRFNSEGFRVYGYLQYNGTIPDEYLSSMPAYVDGSVLLLIIY